MNKGLNNKEFWLSLHTEDKTVEQLVILADCSIASVFKYLHKFKLSCIRIPRKQKFKKGRIDPNKGKRLKQFCPQGHDTFVHGRTKNGTCKQCKRDDAKRRRTPEKQREYYHRNPARFKKYHAKWAAKNKDKIRNNGLKTSVGITLDDYNKMFEQQKGKCLICGKHQKDLKRILNVDHNHITGRVRGLLCFNCNNGLGCFMDNIELLNIAIAYLELDKRSL